MTQLLYIYTYSTKDLKTLLQVPIPQVISASLKILNKEIQLRGFGFMVFNTIFNNISAILFK
jgi:hypothetical protein